MSNCSGGQCFIFCIVSDVDECLTNHGGCSHQCVNMAGTYRCECPPGSTLHYNRRDCTGEYISLQNIVITNYMSDVR